MNFSQHYTKFCKLFSVTQYPEKFPTFDSKLIWFLFGLTERQIKLSGQILTLVIGIPLSIILFMENFSILNQILCYFFLFLFNYQINHFFSDKVHNIQIENNRYYQTLILELNMLLLSSKESIDRNCLIIELLSKYPSLIINFDESIIKLYNGEKLEYFAQNLIFYSELFQDYIFQILNFDFKRDFLDFIIKYNIKFEEKFKINLKSLETNLDLFFFIAFFFPILYIFTSGLWSISWMETILLISIYSYLLKKIINNSIFRDFGLVGLFDFNKSKDKEQFLSFLYFLKKLSQALESYSPEYALLETISNLNHEFQDSLKINENNYLFEFTSLQSIISNFFKTINNPKIELFETFFEETFRFSSKNSPIFLKNLVGLISNHLELENERVITLRSAITKINILKIILGLVLGVISPFLFQFGILLEQLKIGLFNSVYTVFSIPYYMNMITTLVFLGLSLNYLNYIDLTNKKIIFSISSILIFLISFCITSFFLF